MATQYTLPSRCVLPVRVDPFGWVSETGPPNHSERRA